MTFWARLLICLNIVYTASSVYAADSVLTNNSGSERTAIIQTFFGLIFVVALIYALAWLAKRTNLGALGRDRGLKVLVVLPLGTREKAVLVDIAGTQMLLGVAPGRVSKLHVFPRPVIETEFDKAPTSSLSASTASEFSKKLNEFLGQGNKPQ